MVDTTVGTMTSPDGPSDISGNSNITYTLSFEPDGEGVRASVDLTDFTGRIQPPMGAPMSVSQTQAGLRSYVVRLDSRGLDEFAAGQRRRSPSQLPLFVDAWEAMFPRLPGGDVEPGDSWADTVTTWVAGEGERVVAYTYTLDSETTVDGRRQLRVAISGDARPDCYRRRDSHEHRRHRDRVLPLGHRAGARGAVGGVPQIRGEHSE